MATVDKLIFNALAQHRSVVLGGVGWLEVRRRKAKRISESRIIPPQNVVKFAPEEPSSIPSVVDMLVATGGADENAAVALYQSWLEGARSAGEVKIDGVGHIKEGKFIATRTLHTALNPEKEDIVTMKKDNFDSPWYSRGSVWAWILVAVLAVALIYILCRQHGMLGPGGGNSTQEEIYVPRKAPQKTLPATENPSDSLSETAVSAPATTDKVKVGVNTGGTADVSVEVKTTSSGTGAASSSPSSSSSENIDKPASASQPAIAKRAPVYHVIAGAFAVESNADNLVAQVRRNYPELHPQKIRNSRNGLTMVSIFSSPTQREAAGMMDNYWDIDLYLWVYKAN